MPHPQSTEVRESARPWQVGVGFNRDYWERLERWCRGLTEHYPTVLVFTGKLSPP